MDIVIGASDGLILCILVLFLGNFLTARLSFLQQYNIPTAVTGGLICSSIVGIIYWTGGPQITFDMQAGDPSRLWSELRQCFLCCRTSPVSDS